MHVRDVGATSATHMLMKLPVAGTGSVKERKEFLKIEKLASASQVGYRYNKARTTHAKSQLEVRRQRSRARVSELPQDGGVVREPAPPDMIASGVVGDDALLRGVVELEGGIEEIWVPVDGVERVVGVHLPLQRDPRVVLHMFAYVGSIDNCSDTMSCELLRVPDAGEHQNLWSANGPWRLTGKYLMQGYSAGPVPAERMTSFSASICIRGSETPNQSAICRVVCMHGRRHHYTPDASCASSTPKNTGPPPLSLLPLPVPVCSTRVTLVPMRTSKFPLPSASCPRNAVAALLRTPPPIVDCSHPTPRGFPPFMSTMKGNSAASSAVVCSTRASSTLAFPGRLVSSGPVVPCAEGSICPCGSCPSAGGVRVSLCTRRVRAAHSEC